jgi:hypothetical protein
MGTIRGGIYGLGDSNPFEYAFFLEEALLGECMVSKEIMFLGVPLFLEVTLPGACLVLEA